MEQIEQLEPKKCSACGGIITSTEFEYCDSCIEQQKIEAEWEKLGYNEWIDKQAENEE